MTHKKLVSVVAFMLLASLCLFAETSSVSFRLFHSVNPMDEHGFLFYDSKVDSEITSVELTSNDDYEFARLMVVFNLRTVSGIELKFTDLVSVAANADGSYNCFPYQIWGVNRSTGGQLGEKIVRTNLETDSPNASVGAIELYSTENPLTLTPRMNGALELREVAMLHVDLDEESAAAGSYAGSIKAVFTSN